MTLSILYRGYLSDCNYSCAYCPFATSKNNAAMRKNDRLALWRFVDWVELNSSSRRPLSILIAPYGEALVRGWYREAVVHLSHLAYVKKIAVQTNLSCHTGWLADCKPDKTALWVSFHPDFVSLDKFLIKCKKLLDIGIKFSVGTVGIREHFTAIAELRARLPDSVYLWVNAYKDQAHYYQPAEINYLARIDPHFKTNLPVYPSQGKACHTGYDVVSIEGSGDLYRCNFINECRGNIFSGDLDTMLWRSPCSRQSCDCHIGYVHMDELALYEVYGDSLLERIAQKPPMN
ncbi:MAG: STM4011 family radical SAM protein [Gallionellaceae bacterium]